MDLMVSAADIFCCAAVPIFIRSLVLNPSTIVNAAPKIPKISIVILYPRYSEPCPSTETSVNAHAPVISCPIFVPRVPNIFVASRSCVSSVIAEINTFCGISTVVYANV